MTSLKILFFAFTLLSATASSFAQTDVKHARTHTKTRFKVDDSTPIFDKKTNRQISQKEFRDIIRENPRVHLEKEINERGNIARLIYDANGSGFITRDPDKRVKAGEPFPKFIFTTINKEQLASKDLTGDVVVLYFNMALEEPFASKQRFADFEKVLQSSPIKSNMKPVILTQSTQKEALAFTANINLPYSIVADATNFFEKYLILRFPSFIVVKKDGTLGAYADDLDELKEALAKLK